MSGTPTNLAQFIAQLKQAEFVPRPATDHWDAHIANISVPGRIAEITEEQYDYWLEVLPPKYQRGSHFCFAEGAEAFRLFCYDPQTDRYYCRQLTWDGTLTFCRLANISIPW